MINFHYRWIKMGTVGEAGLTPSTTRGANPCSDQCYLADPKKNHHKKDLITFSSKLNPVNNFLLAFKI